MKDFQEIKWKRQGEEKASVRIYIYFKQRGLELMTLWPRLTLYQQSMPGAPVIFIKLHQ